MRMGNMTHGLISLGYVVTKVMMPYFAHGMEAMVKSYYSTLTGWFFSRFIHRNIDFYGPQCSQGSVLLI